MEQQRVVGIGAGAVLVGTALVGLGWAGMLLAAYLAMKGARGMECASLFGSGVSGVGLGVVFRCIGRTADLVAALVRNQQRRNG